MDGPGDAVAGVGQKAGGGRKEAAEFASAAAAVNGEASLGICRGGHQCILIFLGWERAGASGDRRQFGVGSGGPFDEPVEDGRDAPAHVQAGIGLRARCSADSSM